MPDMDQIKGKANEALGGAQEHAGRATGDRDMEAGGAKRKGEGKAQGMLGKVKDAVGDASFQQVARLRRRSLHVGGAEQGRKAAHGRVGRTDLHPAHVRGHHHLAPRVQGRWAGM